MKMVVRYMTHVWHKGLLNERRDYRALADTLCFGVAEKKR